MTERMVRVYDPTAEPVSNRTRLAARPSSLQGKTIGILDNGKANAGMLMQAVVEAMKERFGVTDFIVRNKPVAGPAPAQAVADLTAQCAAVLVGSAD
jgi:hypothetical protein